jgi:hypothetical protein
MGPATLPDGHHFQVRVSRNLKEGSSFLLRGGENAAGREEFVQERKLCAMGFGLSGLLPMSPAIAETADAGHYLWTRRRRR